jgi:hypothetical protein
VFIQFVSDNSSYGKTYDFGTIGTYKWDTIEKGLLAEHRRQSFYVVAWLAYNAMG